MRDYRQLEVEVVGLVLPGLVVLEAKLVGQVKPARRVDQEVALPPLLHLAQVSRVPLACRELPVACRVPLACRVLPVACRVLPVACRVLPVACRVLLVACRVLPLAYREL
ncbi:MAG: hypothetical protein VX304_05350, partial [Planctomycetota bacterium]|nr:hypothetical protein [Planctomycetota bacterium]